MREGNNDHLCGLQRLPLCVTCFSVSAFLGGGEGGPVFAGAEVLCAPVLVVGGGVW